MRRRGDRGVRGTGTGSGCRYGRGGRDNCSCWRSRRTTWGCFRRQVKAQRRARSRGGASCSSATAFTSPPRVVGSQSCAATTRLTRPPLRAVPGRAGRGAGPLGDANAAPPPPLRLSGARRREGCALSFPPPLFSHLGSPALDPRPLARYAARGRERRRKGARSRPRAKQATARERLRRRGGRRSAFASSEAAPELGPVTSAPRGMSVEKGEARVERSGPFQGESEERNGMERLIPEAPIGQHGTYPKIILPKIDFLLLPTGELRRAVRKASDSRGLGV